MRFRTALSIGSLFLLCFAPAGWSTPFRAEAQIKTVASGETGSVSGQISSVGDAGFALEVKKDQKQSTVQFLVDGNTRVEGRLTVGATATVEFRSEDGKNMATHVAVVQASELGSHEEKKLSVGRAASVTSEKAPRFPAPAAGHSV